jgi:hypothetical protein
MTVDYDRQVRPLTTDETGTDDALSVRINELVWSLNNYKAHVGCPVPIPATVVPGTNFQSDDAFSTERLIHVFAPVKIPDGYNRIYWQIGAYMNAAGNTIWRMYSVSQAYLGPATFDTTMLPAGYGVSSITVSSTTEVMPAGVKDLNLQRSAAGEAWLLLTAQNSSAAAGVYCYLTALCATAQIDH